MIYTRTPYRPEDVGYDGSRLEVLNQHFLRMLEKDELQGASYCLARDGEVFVNAALGRYCYRPDDTRELTPDHLHVIASITKLFTAVAIFQLYEDGKLSIDQKVGELLTEFATPPFNTITIGHLLTHTSGLLPDQNCFPNPYYQSYWAHIEDGFKNGDVNWLVNALKAGVRSAPGKEWAYCSFGFCVLGEIISRVSGTFAHQYIKEKILLPCGMDNTMFPESMNEELYLRTTITSESSEKMHEAAAQGLPFFEEPYLEQWSKVPQTGGGLYSNAMDLTKFGTMLLQNGTYHGNRILSRKAVEKMTSLSIQPNIVDYCWEAGGQFHPYGLGPDLRRNGNNMYSPGTYFHEGAGSCCLIVDPTERLVAAWFVPYTHDAWYAHGLYHASNIMWSGLL